MNTIDIFANLRDRLDRVEEAYATGNYKKATAEAPEMLNVANDLYYDVWLTYLKSYPNVPRSLK